MGQTMVKREMLEREDARKREVIERIRAQDEAKAQEQLARRAQAEIEAENAKLANERAEQRRLANEQDARERRKAMQERRAHLFQQFVLVSRQWVNLLSAMQREDRIRALDRWSHIAYADEQVRFDLPGIVQPASKHGATPLEGEIAL